MNNELKSVIIKKIDDIIDILIKINTDDIKEIGIFRGASGIALSLFYLSKYCSDKSDKLYSKGFNLIEKSIELINCGYSNYILSSGLTGFAWTINHLAKEEFISNKDFLFINKIDDFLKKNCIKNLSINNYDYLNGALGVGFYYLTKVNESKKHYKFICETIELLEKKSIKDLNNKIQWKTTYPETEEKFKYNLSLAHGISAIIVYLSKLLFNGINPENKVRNLLNSSVETILFYKLNETVHKYNFPGWIDINCSHKKSNSRLAWCYGDLGIAIAIYQAAKITNNNEWEQISIDVLTYNSNRRDLNEENVLDAGLCHGSSGIAHIFKRLYTYTGKEIFHKTNEYWIKETLKMAKFNDGLAGYKAWYGDNYGGWVNTINLLEGISGIGLSLISSVSDIEPKWDECLLLS